MNSGIKKLADADAQVAGAYAALMFTDPGAAKKLATGADNSAKEGQALVTKALKMFPALPSTAELPDEMPEPEVPVEPLSRLTPQVPEEHRAEFAERLAYFRVVKEQRLALFTGTRIDVLGKVNWFPSALAPPRAEDLPQRLLKATAAARTSFSNGAEIIRRDTNVDIDKFAAAGAGWLRDQGSGSEDFAKQMASVKKGFAMLTEAEGKLIEAYQAIEAQIAAEEPDFSGAEKLSEEADSTAGKGAMHVEESLAALGKLL